jgi:hypothetical protein
VPLGTLNVHENAPVEFAVNEPDVQVVIVTPSNTSDASATDSENPVPDTVTVAPFGPWPGEAVIVGVVTVNDAVAVVPVAPSVPMTLYGPADSLGTLNVHVNAPVGLVVIVVPLAVPTVHPVGICSPPLNATVAGEDTVNPLPVTVYVAPTGPWPGESVIAGVVTVNVPLAV